jgi:D-galactarolactone cycloisomerase
MINLPSFAPIRLAKVEALVLRSPVAEPVQTSFGVMHDRPAVLVRIEDSEGAVGWGEIWCNFPGVGAEHRARVLESCVAPVLLDQAWAHPTLAFQELTRRLHVLGLQCGEPGTMAQAIAGADIAMWDLVGRRLGIPLWQLLGGGNQVQTYASGLSPTNPEKLAAARRAEGYRAFKLKVGFGAERDLANLRALRELFGADTVLMVDANQAWALPEALDMSRRLAEFAPTWLEEPLAADTALSEWRRLAAQSPIPLAAGENMRGETEFTAAIDSGAFKVMQPDIGKWGGFSGCLAVARLAMASGKMFCPHWLGGGIGLVASMQLKAAVGGAGYVEVDANPNPLRDMLATPAWSLKEGVVSLSSLPGLGVTPDLAAARGFIVKHHYA